MALNYFFTEDVNDYEHFNSQNLVSVLTQIDNSQSVGQWVGEEVVIGCWVGWLVVGGQMVDGFNKTYWKDAIFY